MILMNILIMHLMIRTGAMAYVRSLVMESGNVQLLNGLKESVIIVEEDS